MTGKDERDRIARVLVVEDDDGQRFTLTSILERDGFEVLGCATAAEALDLVRHTDFGVAVVDLRLPDLEGTQLLGKIRSCNSQIRVIIHTAYGSFDSAKDSVNRGAFAYVEKAGDPGVLLHHVHRASREQMDVYAGDLESAVAQRTVELRKANAALRCEIADRECAEDERRGLEDQLRQAQKLEAIGTLAAGVAHDFNNFLTAIVGYTGLARADIPAGSRALQALEGVEHAVQQAGGVTQSLLMFCRKAPVRRTPVRLDCVVEVALRMLRRMLPASIQIITNNSTEDELWVDGDVTQLQQVVMNLAINARDAMPDGGELRVTVQPADRDSADVLSAVRTQGEGSAMIVVEDTGVGMSDDVRSRVFEPFYTTKPRDQGTGLGMAVVHGIVTDHNGHIQVESKPGHGTRVAITLPRCKAPEQSEMPSALAHVERGHGETVIVVEDDEQILGIITSALRSAGYAVVQASDGAQAMAVFRDHQAGARLLVLDLDLPKQSGRACLEGIRETRPDMPAIAITGDIEMNGGGLGQHTRFLRKPFRIADLMETVSTVLQEHKQQQA